MEYHLLRETQDNSGLYELTGEVLYGSLQEAMRECVMRTQAGRRHAIYVYDAVIRRNDLIQQPQSSNDGEEAHVPGTEA